MKENDVPKMACSTVPNPSSGTVEQTLKNAEQCWNRSGTPSLKELARRVLQANALNGGWNGAEQKAVPLSIESGTPCSAPCFAPKTTPEQTLFLESVARLESAGILLAVLDDGTMRMVFTEGEAHRAVLDGFTVYTPRDVYYYIQLEPHERRMLHAFKQRFGGTVEWEQP